VEGFVEMAEVAGRAGGTGRGHIKVVFHRPHRYGELWCGAILPNKRACKVTKGAKRKEKSVSADSLSVRATISFPPELYKTLEGIAREKKVSLAWVVREAADNTRRENGPYLPTSKRVSSHD